MIITCEKCDTRFNLDDSLISKTGSKVRCSICKDVFFVTPEPEPQVSESLAEADKVHEEESDIFDDAGISDEVDDAINDILDDDPVASAASAPADVDTSGINRILEEDAELFSEDDQSLDDLDMELDRVFETEASDTVDEDDLSVDIVEDDDKNIDDQFTDAFDDLNIELPEESQDSVVQLPADEESFGSTAAVMSIDDVLMDDSDTDDFPEDMEEEGDTLDINEIMTTGGDDEESVDIESLMSLGDEPSGLPDEELVDMTSLLAVTDSEIVDMSSLLVKAEGADDLDDISDFLSDETEDATEDATAGLDLDSSMEFDIEDSLDFSDEPKSAGDDDEGEDLLDILSGSDMAEEAEPDDIDIDDIIDDFTDDATEQAVVETAEKDQAGSLSAEDLISEFEEYDKDAASRAEGLDDFDDLEITFDGSGSDDFDLDSLASDDIDLNDDLEVTMDSEGLGDALLDESNLDMDFSLDDIDEEADDDARGIDDDSDLDDGLDLDDDFGEEDSGLDVEDDKTMVMDEKPDLGSVDEIMEQDEFDFSNIEDIIDVDDTSSQVPDEPEEDIQDLELEELDLDDTGERDGIEDLGGDTLTTDDDLSLDDDTASIPVMDETFELDEDADDEIEILDDDLEFDADSDSELETIDDLDLEEIDTMFDETGETETVSESEISADLDMGVELEAEDINISDLSSEIEEIEADLTSETISGEEEAGFEAGEDLEFDDSDFDLDLDLEDSEIDGDDDLSYDDASIDDLSLDDGDVETIPDLPELDADEDDDFSEIETMLEEEDDILLETDEAPEKSKKSDDMDFSDIESLLDEDTDDGDGLSLDLDEGSGGSEYDLDLEEFDPEASSDDELNKTYELSLDDSSDDDDLSESLELSLDENDFDDMPTELEESLSISLEGPEADFLDADLEESLDITLNDLEEDEDSGFDAPDSKTVNLDITDEKSNAIEEMTVESQADDKKKKKKAKKEKKKSYKKKKTSKSLVFFFILILLVAGGWYFITQTGFNLGEFEIPYMNKKVKELNMPPEVADFLGVKLEKFSLVPLQNTITGKYAADNKLFVITGDLRNDSNVPVSHIKVRGTLLSTTNKELKTKTVFCGNIIPDDKLEKMNMRDINKILMNRSGDKNSNMNVPPGRKIPFMIVFDKLPDSLGNMKVEAVQIK